MNRQDDRHWLDDPAHVKLLWRGFLVVLALTVVAELFVHLHPHFEIESVFGFSAWFGFGACAAVTHAQRNQHAGQRRLALVLKRPDTYYGQHDD